MTSAAGSLVQFAELLRSHGLQPGNDAVVRWIQAAGNSDSAIDQSVVIEAAASMLCHSRQDWEALGRAVLAWAGIRITLPGAERSAAADRASRGILPASTEELASEQVNSDLLALVAGSTDQLAHRDHRDLTDAERAEVNALISRLVANPDERPRHRSHATRRGEIDLAATVRQMLRDGGELDRVLHHSRQRSRRRVLLILDVSHSMDAYSESLLRFAHAIVRSAPGTTEAFAFSTRLTRLTEQLRQLDPERAVNEAGGAIPDWGGGTALGACLRQLLAEWGQSPVVRSTYCMIASDGWCSDPAVVKVQLPRLAQLSRRLIWADPQAGVPGFEPYAEVTRDLRTHFTELLPCHSVDALRELALALTVTARQSIGS